LWCCGSGSGFGVGSTSDAASAGNFLELFCEDREDQKQFVLHL
jgi:hypothetical protein